MKKPVKNTNKTNLPTVDAQAVHDTFVKLQQDHPKHRRPKPDEVRKALGLEISMEALFRLGRVTGLDNVYLRSSLAPQDFSRIQTYVGFLNATELWVTSQPPKRPNKPQGIPRGVPISAWIIRHLDRNDLRQLIGEFGIQSGQFVTVTFDNQDYKYRWQSIIRYAMKGEIKAIPEFTTLYVLKNEYDIDGLTQSENLEPTYTSLFNSLAWHILRQKDRGLKGDAQLPNELDEKIQHGMLALRLGAARGGRRSSLREPFYSWHDTMDPLYSTPAHRRQNEKPAWQTTPMPANAKQLFTLGRFIQSRLESGNNMCPTRQELRTAQIDLGGPSKG